MKKLWTESGGSEVVSGNGEVEEHTLQGDRSRSEDLRFLGLPVL